MPQGIKIAAPNTRWCSSLARNPVTIAIATFGAIAQEIIAAIASVYVIVLIRPDSRFVERVIS